ncbi:MAG: VWA domain-containing protein [Vicinamibacterales bacterium]
MLPSLSLTAITTIIGVGAQVPSGDAQRFFVRTDVVSVDVSVLDRKGQPVRGLTAADFTILENGRAQTVEYFDYIELPAPPAVPALWMRDIAPDVARNEEILERRLVVILMDDAMVPFDGQIVKAARQIARDVVDRLGPADLAAVVFSRANRAAQNFTQDRARLLAAIDTFDSGGFAPEPGADRKPDIAGSYFIDSAQTLFRTVDTLAAVTERRKALIYVSTGIPLRIDTPDVSTSDHPYLNWLTRQTMDRAQRGSVNVYSVDPGGLDGLRWYMRRRNTRTEAWIAELIEQEPARYRDFLQAVAENTGGRAFVNTNEFASRIDQMFLETGSFYLLGYRPQDQRADGRFRKLQVRLKNRRDLTVRARRGYWAPPRPGSAKMALPPAVDDALAGLVPRTDLPLELSAAAFGMPGRPEAAVIVTLGARAPRTPGASSATGDKVDVVLSAFTPQGDPRGSVRMAADVTPAAGTEDAVAYDVLGRLDLRPGRYELRASASSASTGVSGSVYGYLDVPDFARDALSLSGLTLGTTPPRIAGNAEAAAGVLPFTPTTRRTFSPTDSVEGFVRVYQGGSTPLAPATIVTTIRTAANEMVFNKSQPVGSDEFGADRALDYRFELPMVRLKPGPHLLTIEVTGPVSARRDVRFDVR